MRYYLGLDNGGTATKAALFTRDGREAGVCAVDTLVHTPRPGFAERDMEEMWQANCRVIRAVLVQSGISPADISGIGVCGHGKGLYLWGKDGKPARAGILSTDNRAYEYPLRWEADGTQQKAFQKNCQKILSCQPAALLAWLRDHEPEVMQNLKWVFGCKDYVRFRLTGEPGAELTDLSGTGLLNLYTRDYDDELLRLLGLESVREAFPPICRSAEIVGFITPKAAAECGLSQGTPVIGGMFDIDACALAAGVTDERKLCMIAGTWSINEYLRRQPVTDGSVSMNSLFCLPQYYLIEESSPTSAGNLAWFVRQLLPELHQQAKAQGESVYKILDSWAAKIPPWEFVPVFLPFLLAGNVHPNAKAVFAGLTAFHTREHLCRSVYEGIAFSHRYHFEKLMCSRPDQPFDCIRLAGGAARSEIWAQMFADVMGSPVETVLAGETGALGCAMAVSAALGDTASLPDAALQMCSVSARAKPNPKARGIYDEKYALYRTTIDCLDSLWPRMQAMIEREES